MKIEFTSVESEPLLYFLLHSGVFVVGMAGVFFLLGMWFGALTWGHHRRKNKKLHAEGEAFRAEIAGLKRKLAEHALRPVTAPLPAAPLLTDAVPKNSVAALEIEPPLLPEVSPEKPPLEVFVLPALPAFPEQVLPNNEVTKDSKVRQPRRLAIPPPETVEENSVMPFSFLLPDSPEEAVDSKDDPHSIWADISSSLNTSAEEESVHQPSVPEVMPENDPDLGLIFKERPADADDLTRVQGISPALQKRLQELGVYRLQQIAVWNQAQVREYSRRLAFKDRIDRERWVDQARRLMVAESI